MEKNVLVTGAGGGMGRAVCEKLTKEGYHVWGIDLLPPEEGLSWRYLCVDVTDPHRVEEAAEFVRKEAGTLYAIVHTAGIYELDSLVEMSEERFIRTFDVNLFGVYRVNKAFLPFLQPSGRIVITTSELAPLDPLPFTGIYGISKTALEKYAYSLRMELQLLGHFVSVIRPRAVKTGLLSVSTKKLEIFCGNTTRYRCNAERFKRIVDSVEAKNVPPERVAGLVDKALGAKRPKYVYNLNRNPLLRLLNALPASWQTSIIGRILK